MRSRRLSVVEQFDGNPANDLDFIFQESILARTEQSDGSGIEQRHVRLAGVERIQPDGGRRGFSHERLAALLCRLMFRRGNREGLRFLKADNPLRGDLGKMRELLKRPLMVDLRNIYRPGDLAEAGFTYVGVGRGPVGSK